MPDVTNRPGTPWPPAGNARPTGDRPDPDPAAAAATAPGSSWKARLGRLEWLLNQRSRSPAAKRWLLGSALALFVVVSVASFSTLPDDVTWRPWLVLLLVFVTTPLTVTANAAEYRVMAAISGHRVSWVESARLTVLATAANLLPLPGGIVVRTQALRREGTTYRRALAANAAAGLTWIAVGCLAAGVLLGFRPDEVPLAVVAALLLAGGAGLAAVWLLLRRADAAAAHRHLGGLFVVELVTVAISSVRIYLAFQLMGQAVEPVQAVALSASLIIAAAIGIFPAGLGIREVLAGAIGVAVGLSTSESIAATAVDRIAGQVGLAILAAVMLGTVRNRAADREPPAPPVPDELPAPDARNLRPLDTS